MFCWKLFVMYEDGRRESAIKVEQNQLIAPLVAGSSMIIDSVVW